MASPLNFRIGYALAEKKINSFLKESLRVQSSKKGIQYLAIDVSKPLTEQGPFDAILHKYPNSDWDKQLEEYRSLHPDVIILDPPESIERLHNRVSMLQVFEQEKSYDSYGLVGIPKQLIITEKLEKAVLFNKFELSGLKFPVIAKPLVADGTFTSHLMWLVYNKSGLEKLTAPFLLQQFVNHGGVLFKVYVVGDHVKSCRRKSLPDVQEAELGNDDGLQSFSHISNTTQGGTGEAIDRSLASTPLPPENLVAAISERLRRKLGLRLFNYDLIRDSGASSNFFIVDINYFPGYAKMPDYENVLTDFFVNLARGKSLKTGEEKEPGHFHGSSESLSSNTVDVDS